MRPVVDALYALLLPGRAAVQGVVAHATALGGMAVVAHHLRHGRCHTAGLRARARPAVGHGALVVVGSILRPAAADERCHVGGLLRGLHGSEHIVGLLLLHGGGDGLQPPLHGRGQRVGQQRTVGPPQHGGEDGIAADKDGPTRGGGIDRHHARGREALQRRRRGGGAAGSGAKQVGSGDGLHLALAAWLGPQPDGGRTSQGDQRRITVVPSARRSMTSPRCRSATRYPPRV